MRQTYEATGTVLEAEGAGPVLCLGAIADSLPPQCGGIPIEGWDWDAVSGQELAARATWGNYTVTGLYDGETFTLIEAAPPRPPKRDDDPIEPGCSQPAGGWVLPDADRASDVDYEKAIREARKEPDFSGAWVDYIGAPSEFNEEIILTLAFTGDLTRHEEQARETWGGPLCVVRHEKTYRELRRIQNELHEIWKREFGLEVLASGTYEYRGVVAIEVLIVDAATQEELDARYGAGVVEVTAQLRPIR